MGELGEKWGCLGRNKLEFYMDEIWLGIGFWVAKGRK